MKKIILFAGLLGLSTSVFAYPDYCGDPVISPSPIPPECTELAIDGMWEKHEDQQTLVCRYTDGALLRINNIALFLPQNDLTQTERCELLRCVFNKASWCK